MSDLERVPYERDAQRAVARRLADVTAGRTVRAGESRALVMDSWQRCLRADVRADLHEAPVVLRDDALEAARAHADWLPFATRAAERLNVALAGGHILSLFDASGRMLACEGDLRALEGLARINFRPGALWSESAVGTNGPGTALATLRPVHIVGAEHFCEAWHEWHCAAVTLRDEATDEVLGVIDVSGFRRYAHPHTLDLATTLATSVQQMLAAREAERRYAVLHRLTELTEQYGREPLVAVDRAGRVLYATPSTPDGLRPGTATPATLRAAIAAHVRDSASRRDGEEIRLTLCDDVGLTAVSHPVMEGSTAVGCCLLLRGSAGPRAAQTLPPMLAPPARRAAVTRYRFDDIVGLAPKLADARRVAVVAARNDLPVLLLGESGTGKEVFAQAIHRAGSRHAQPFVAVNCASLPRELLEAELFGYVGGAFTGARREGSRGKFSAAEGGTLFLDEVCELPPTAQASLLRVLQEREVTAIGSVSSRPTDVRVIAATNRDIGALLSSGDLRADLYYRLNVLTIALPALRERAEDIPALAQYFLEAAVEELRCGPLAFGDGAVDLLARHGWPGNIRELKNLIRRLAALAEGFVVTVEAVAAACAAPGASVPDTPMAVGSLAAERDRTLGALRSASTMREAAARLGVNRSTLYRRLARYGVTPERLLQTH